MADIFISYANEDRETAGQLARALESAGLSVWWDRRIPAGRTWRAVLEEALQSMRCLIVLWSENSLKSPWVLEEAEEARRLDKLLFPVLIGHVAPPVGFRAIQAANLIDWDGSADMPAVPLLIADLQALLGEAKRPRASRKLPMTLGVDLQVKRSHGNLVRDGCSRVTGRNWLVAEPPLQGFSWHYKFQCLVASPAKLNRWSRFTTQRRLNCRRVD